MIDRAKAFDIAVIGAGMMGSAAARHLAKMGARVVLIGPPEPDAKTAHNGVFASHYDQARISRNLDSNHDWSRLAQASIDRYAGIAEAGGRKFYRPVGSIMAGPETGPDSTFIQNALKVGKDRRIAHEELRGDKLRARFPFFDFPDGMLVLYEENGGGWINPRHHVAAQIKAAKRLGVSMYQHEVRSVTEKRDHVVIACADGMEVSAGKAVIACGAFSKAEGLLPEPIPMEVYARTVTFLELPNEEIARLRNMPSVVYIPPDKSCDPYILPPVPYADGKTYLKLGGDPEDIQLETVEDIKAWFQSNGDERVGAFLRDQLLRLMPDLNYTSVSFGSCVTSFTPSGKPLIYQQTERLIALTGGNGAGAKCSDELGRLGAKLAFEGDIDGEGYETDFRP